MRHLELIFKQCDCSEKDNPLGVFFVPLLIVKLCLLSFGDGV